MTYLSASAVVITKRRYIFTFFLPHVTSLSLLIRCVVTFDFKNLHRYQRNIVFCILLSWQHLPSTKINFNYSLGRDDSFLLNFVRILENFEFCISQGSVSTCLRCGGKVLQEFRWKCSSVRCSRGLVVTATDLHPANLGSTLAVCI